MGFETVVSYYETTRSQIPEELHFITNPVHTVNYLQ